MYQRNTFRFFVLVLPTQKNILYYCLSHQLKVIGLRTRLETFITTTFYDDSRELKILIVIATSLSLGRVVSCKLVFQLTSLNEIS